MEKESEIRDAIMREINIFVDRTKEFDKRTRGAMAAISQILQQKVEREDQMRLWQSVLSRKDANTKRIETASTQMISFFKELCDNSPQAVSMVKKVFSYVNSNPDGEAAKTDLSAAEYDMYQMLAFSVLGKRKEAEISETLLAEMKAHIATGQSVLGLLSGPLLNSYREISHHQKKLLASASQKKFASD